MGGGVACLSWTASTNFDYLVEIMLLKSFYELRILVRKMSTLTNFDKFYEVDEVDSFDQLLLLRRSCRSSRRYGSGQLRLLSISYGSKELRRTSNTCTEGAKFD